MERVVVYFYTEAYANMEADLIVECDDCYKVFSGTELVGVFSKNLISAIYKTKVVNK